MKFCANEFIYRRCNFCWKSCLWCCQKKRGTNMQMVETKTGGTPQVDQSFWKKKHFVLPARSFSLIICSNKLTCILCCSYKDLHSLPWVSAKCLVWWILGRPDPRPHTGNAFFLSFITGAPCKGSSPTKIIFSLFPLFSLLSAGKWQIWVCWLFTHNDGALLHCHAPIFPSLSSYHIVPVRCSFLCSASLLTPSSQHTRTRASTLLSNSTTDSLFPPWLQR